MTDAEHVLRHAVEMLDEFGADTGDGVPGRVYSPLVEVARRRLPGVESASVTIFDRRRITTAAATDEAARKADRFQYDRGAGPSVDAVRGEALSHLPELPDGDEISALGFSGILSLRLTDATSRYPTALNLYAAKPHAFDAPTIELARLLAVHARVSLAAADCEARAAHLERSRETTGQIGTAVGILMTTRELGHTEAMELLRTTSQHTNIRVSDLAAQVIGGGVLPQRKKTGPRRP